MHNDGRNDVDCFHRTLPRFITKRKANPKLRNAKEFTIQPRQIAIKANQKNAARSTEAASAKITATENQSPEA